MLRSFTYGCAIALLLGAAAIAAGGPTTPAPAADSGEGPRQPNGAGDGAGAHAPAAAVDAAALDIHAFEKRLPGLDAARTASVARGRDLFEVSWLPGPSPGEKDGLGPLLNARACNECHLRAGRGRARGPQWGGLPGLVLRIGVRSRHDGAADAIDRPHPRYGRQIQDRSLAGVRREAGVTVRWTDHRVTFPDGTARTLKRPSFTAGGEAYGPLSFSEGDPEPFEVVSGARLAPALVGLGLLEAIPVADIVAAADPDDRDGDGVSGRVAHLGGGHGPIGRFGWKATHDTLESQIAEAFAEDVGITSDLYPAESFPEAQHRVLAMASGGTPELSDEELADTANFIRALAVPKPLPRSPEAERGRTHFETVGCAHCHTPKWRTAADHPWQELRDLEIEPYTDLLLHDLGPDLADRKRDGVAEPAEWRTPPLWGLGRHPVVNGNAHLLHDGRARTIEEAILWHGGEAARSRAAYMALPKEERAALLELLEGL